MMGIGMGEWLGPRRRRAKARPTDNSADDFGRLCRPKSMKCRRVPTGGEVNQ